MLSDTELDQTLSNTFLRKKASSNKGKRRERKGRGGGGGTLSQVRDDDPKLFN